MSGGSYNYIYSSLLEECENRMYDAEMNDLINDLCEVLHDLEWWQSCDSSEEKYRATVEKFKAKWFKEDRTRLKGYIDETIENLKKFEKIEILKKFENSTFEESFKEVCAFDITIQVLERYVKRYMKEGKNNEKLC